MPLMFSVMIIVIFDNVSQAQMAKDGNKATWGQAERGPGSEAELEDIPAPCGTSGWSLPLMGSCGAGLGCDTVALLSEGPFIFPLSP